MTKSKQDPLAPRYQRQLVLPGMTAAAQQKLFDAHVVLLGAGGVGGTCAAFLADAGVGSLVLVDPADAKEEDLTSQILFTEQDVGTPKVEAARNRLLQLNPYMHVQAQKERLNTHNADRLIGRGDVIVDAIGNWQDKLAISDCCFEKGKTLVHSGVLGFEFHLYTMIPGRSACLRCLFADVGIEDVVSSGGGAHGVLGPVAGMAGSFLAVEVIKLICGLGTTPGTNLTKFDALRRYVDQIIELAAHPDCPDCGRPGGAH